MKTANVLLIFCFSLSIFVMAACGICGKKIDCPGYKNDMLDSWFPYQDNQQLRFRSTTNDSFLVTLQQTQLTSPYQTTTGGYGSQQGCSAEKAFQSTEVDSLRRSLLQVHLSTTESMNSAALAIQNTQITIHGFTNTIPDRVDMNNHATSSKIVENVTVGNRQFARALEIRADTAQLKTNLIYRLYLVQGEGLVAYSEYPSLKTWSKQ